MDDLTTRAREYADSILKDQWIDNDCEVFYALAEAYAQGWTDRDTQGETPDTQAEYFNEAPDCHYFCEGFCSLAQHKPCEHKGCESYQPKI